MSLRCVLYSKFHVYFRVQPLLFIQQYDIFQTSLSNVVFDSREELYSQTMDELIRQVTIECAERGLMLLRFVRNDNLFCGEGVYPK